MTQAKLGVGAIIKRGDGGSPETFSALPEVRNIRGPAQEAAVVDATNLDSTGGYEEYIYGIKSGGEVSFDCNLIPQNAVFKAIRSDFDAKRTANFQVILPDASTTTGAFAAIITKIEPSLSAKEVMSCSITLRITGAVTWTP